MGVDQSPEYRRFQRADIQQSRLRLDLADLYRADVKYQWNVQQDLRPLWRRAGGDEAVHVPGFDSVSAAVAAEGTSAGPNEISGLSIPELAAYVEAVRDKTKNTLRLVRHGQPVNWAMSFLHQDVTSHDPFSPATDDDPVLHAPVLQPIDISIVLSVWPTFAKLEMLAEGQRQAFHVGTESKPPYRNISMSALEDDMAAKTLLGHGPAEWRDLEVLAGRLLQAGINAMRERLEASGSGRNPSSLQGQQHDLQQLFRYLFHKFFDFHPTRPEGRAIRERWRKLARLLEIDVPRIPK